MVTRPSNPFRHKPLGGQQNSIRLRLGPNAPQQTLSLQTRPTTSAARRVAAVLGQQHTDVHLVGLGLQVCEETVDAKPVLTPLTVPIGRSVDDPALLLGCQLVPRRVARHSCCFSMAHQVVLALLPGRGLHGLDGAGAQREFVVGDDQTQVHAHYAAKAAAGLAGTHGRVERKHGRNRVGVTDIALRAVQAGGKTPYGWLRHCYRISSCLRRFHEGYSVTYHIDIEATAAAFKGDFDGLQHAGFFYAVDTEAVGDHVQDLSPAGGCKIGVRVRFRFRFFRAGRTAS